MSKINEFSDTLIALQKEFEAKIQAEGEAVLREAFAEIFEKYPSVEAIRWEQYTPFFNDGDPCEFSVGDPRFKVVGSEDEEGDWGDGFSESLSFVKYVELTPEEIASVDPTAYKTSITRDGHVVYPQTTGRYIRNTTGYGGYYEHDGRYYINADIPGVEGIYEDINKIFRAPDEVFESVFGDHSQITVTRDSIEVDEYYHD